MVKIMNTNGVVGNKLAPDQDRYTPKSTKPGTTATPWYMVCSVSKPHLTWLEVIVHFLMQSLNLFCTFYTSNDFSD